MELLEKKRNSPWPPLWMWICRRQIPATIEAALGERYSNQLQQGFNTHLRPVADSPKVCDMLRGHAQVGYMNTATYTTAADTRFNPSDLMTFGAGIDLDLKRWVNNLTRRR